MACSSLCPIMSCLARLSTPDSQSWSAGTERSPGLILALTVIFCLAFSVIIVQAGQERAGYISELRGAATVSREDGEQRPLEEGSPVGMKDAIRTGKKGRVRIVFNDKTIISLGPDSEMAISEYAWSAQSEKGMMKTRIEEGAFRIMGGAITRHSPGQFETETPLATIGIRGSMYAALVREDRVQVVFESGTGIYVRNRGGQVELTLPGLGTTITDRLISPEIPRRFTPGEIADILKRAGLSSSKVYNRSRILNSTTIESGKGSRAGTGSVTVRQGSAINGQVTNESRIQDSSNAAIGQNNEADMGSVVIE